MNTLYIRQRLLTVTPRALFRLTGSVCVVTNYPLTSYTIKGVLAIGGLRGKKKWTIAINSHQVHKEKLYTLIHELFHVFLVEKGLDNLKYDQTYSDRMLTQTACGFMERYPYVSEQIWKQLVNK